MRIGVIDFSSIAHMHYHATAHEPMGAMVRRTVGDVVKTAAMYDHVAVCVDRPPYKRAEIWPQYKEHREKMPNAVKQQFRDAEAQVAERYHVLGSDGYEADDIIATVVAWARAGDHEVTIHTGDKDLMQLVGDGAKVISVQTGQEYGPDEVREKFGVDPAQIPDYLALVGDKSDNIPGIKGAGPKTVAKWLGEYRGLAGVMASVGDLEPERFRALIVQHDNDLLKWRQLTELDSHAPITPEIIMQPKEPPAPEAPDEIGDLFDSPAPQNGAATEPQAQPAALAVTTHTQPSLLDQVLDATPYERQLEPRNKNEAWGTAKMLFESRAFGDWPNPHAIMAAIMTGRSLGIDAVASVRGMHFVKGKIAFDAALLRGLCQRHPQCKYFRCVETNDKRALFETLRDGDPEPTKIEYTIAMAERAGLTRGGSGWKNNPEDMLRARASSKLARVVYADVCSGLYAPEELED